MITTIDHGAILETANRLPPLPQSAIRLTTLLASEESDFREIVKVIEYDAPLTMKLLRMANSAYSGGTGRIGSIHQALVRLGTGTVAGFVMSASVRSILGGQIPGYGISEQDFWLHSLATAFAAESIQSHSTSWHGTLSFTAGLLHDIGKLVLGRFLTEESRIWLERAIAEGHQPAYRAELELFSLHHGEAGGLIAQRWELPECLVKAITFHHTPDDGHDPICHVTHLANAIAHEVVREDSEQAVPTTTPPTGEFVSACAKLGLSDSDITFVRSDTRRGLHAVFHQLD